MNCFVYIIRCGDGTLYTGWTNDLSKRFKAHCDGLGAKYTSGRGPLKLVYAEEADDISAALHREAEIKKMKKNDKEKLIYSCPALMLERIAEINENKK